MYSLQTIKDNITEGQDLALLASVYSEIAITRLAKIRKNIERNRQFVKELSEVFHIVKKSADAKGVKSSLSTKGTASLLITSNQKLYGGLESRLIEFFIAHSALDYGDKFVLGKIGQSYLNGINFKAKFTPIVFQKDLPDTSEFEMLSKVLSSYEKILVYHGKLQTALVQRPVVTEVSGLVDPFLTRKEKDFYYIFEPEMPKMLAYFEQQIKIVLLEQTLLESELARTGARVISMEQSESQAKDFVKYWRKELAGAQKSIKNAQILELSFILKEHQLKKKS